MQLSQEWGIEGLVWLDGDSSTLGRWAILAVDPIKQICCHGLPNTTKDRNPFRELNDLERFSNVTLALNFLGTNSFFP